MLPFDRSLCLEHETELFIWFFQVGLIIGRGGETIKSLQSHSGVRIQVCGSFCILWVHCKWSNTFFTLIVHAPNQFPVMGYYLGSLHLPDVIFKCPVDYSTIKLRTQIFMEQFAWNFGWNIIFFSTLSARRWWSQQGESWQPATAGCGEGDGLILYEWHL